MNIHQLCKRSPVTIDHHAPVRAAAQAMRDQQVGALVVTQPAPKRRKVVGVLTDRDLVVEALASRPAPADVPVGEVMSRSVVAVPASADLAETAAAMRDEGVRRMLVVDDSHHLVGVVSLDDVVEALSGEMADVTQAMRTGIAKEHNAVHPARKGSEHDEPLSLPREALAARWRQISAS